MIILYRISDRVLKKLGRQSASRYLTPIRRSTLPTCTSGSIRMQCLPSPAERVHGGWLPLLDDCMEPNCVLLPAKKVVTAAFQTATCLGVWNSRYIAWVDRLGVWCSLDLSVRQRRRRQENPAWYTR